MTTSVQPQSPAKPNSTEEVARPLRLHRKFLPQSYGRIHRVAQTHARFSIAAVPDSVRWEWYKNKRSIRCSEMAIQWADLSSKAISSAEWNATDLVINMSGYPKQRAFPRSDWDKVEDWDVEDPYGADPLVYQRIFEDIRTRIESLTARLRDGRV